MSGLGAVELRSFFSGLESTVTQFTGSIDELEVDLFEGGSANLGNQTLSEEDGSLLRSDTATLDQDEIFSDDTVMGETTQRSDVLLGQIGSSGGVVDSTFVSDTNTDSVDFLVHFGSVVITELTSSGDLETNSGRMPSSDTSDLSETSMGLSGESLSSESLGNSGVSLTLGDTENVNHLVLAEDLGNSDFLFEMLLGEVDLLGDVTTIDLDFEDVSLLLSEVELVQLGMGNNSDDLAVFLDSVKLALDSLLVAPLLAVLGEGLLLGVHPVLVQSSLELDGQVLGPNGGQSSETSGSFDVTNDTADNNWWGFEDGTGFNDFLLVQLGSWFVDISQDVGHTSLESGEGGKVDWLGSVVLGIAPHSSSMMSSSFSGEETQTSVSGSFELSVRHELI